MVFRAFNCHTPFPGRPAQRLSVSSSLCGKEPRVFVRSSQSATCSPPLSLASHISCVTSPVCSRHRLTPEITPFCTEVSMFVFFKRNQLDAAPYSYKRFSLHHWAARWCNTVHCSCSLLLESSSFGIHTPSACLHWASTFPLRRITFHSHTRSLGHCWPYMLLHWGQGWNLHLQL